VFLLLVSALLFALGRGPRGSRWSESLEEFAESEHDIEILLPVRSCSSGAGSGRGLGRLPYSAECCIDAGCEIEHRERSYAADPHRQS
jgi:hypothetical protein